MLLLNNRPPRLIVNGTLVLFLLFEMPCPYEYTPLWLGTSVSGDSPCLLPLNIVGSRVALVESQTKASLLCVLPTWREFANFVVC